MSRKFSLVDRIVWAFRDEEKRTAGKNYGELETRLDRLKVEEAELGARFVAVREAIKRVT